MPHRRLFLGAAALLALTACGRSGKFQTYYGPPITAI